MASESDEHASSSEKEKPKRLKKAEADKVPRERRVRVNSADNIGLAAKPATRKPAVRKTQNTEASESKKTSSKAPESDSMNTDSSFRPKERKPKPRRDDGDAADSRPTGFKSYAPKEDSKPTRTNFKRDNDESKPQRRPFSSDKPVDRKPRPNSDSGKTWEKKEGAADRFGSKSDERRPYSDKPREARPSRFDSRDKEYKPRDRDSGFEDRKPRGDKPSTPYRESKPARFNSRDKDFKPKDGDSRPSERKPWEDKAAPRKWEARPSRFNSGDRDAPKREFDKNQDTGYSPSRDTSAFDKPERKRFSKEDSAAPARINKFERKAPRKIFEDSDELASGKLPETPAYMRGNKKFVDRPKKAFKPTLEQQDGKIRLNKYIANAGICSRREADDLIKSGVIKVNGKVVDELGFRVSPSDKIQYGDQTLSKEVKRYLLLNKPKDYITTATDPDGRKTVMELVKSMCKERLYPVGRLDRNTTGLLLMTNDGELAKKLTHPSHQVKKIYQVTLDKNLKALDLKKIAEGLTLEDGLAEVDEVAYVGEGNDKTEIGIALHSGKNRIVRRIFEHLGYEVVKLDRTYFAGLTKKDLPRGKSRLLTEKELIMLRMS
jgi:23S rRNA pseudouridine2605 synthase